MGHLLSTLAHGVTVSVRLPVSISVGISTDCPLRLCADWLICLCSPQMEHNPTFFKVVSSLHPQGRATTVTDPMVLVYV